VLNAYSETLRRKLSKFVKLEISNPLAPC